MVSTNLFWKNSENKEPKTAFQTFEANAITTSGAKFCNKTELWRNLLIQWNDTPNVDWMTRKKILNLPLLSISFEGFSLREGVEFKSLW